MENVQRSGPNGATFTDTCQTLPKSEDNATLVATDGVASPENPEPILQIVGKDANGNNAPDTVTFTGRTGDCYYMVSGNYARNGGTAQSGAAAGTTGGSGWTADFDTKSSSWHFVVYINERYRSDDDYFLIGLASMVNIEVANPTDPNCPHPIYFQLSQQPTVPGGNGQVEIMTDDGANVEPVGPDGKTLRKYAINTGITQPNGFAVQVKVRGLAGSGNVSIIATQATQPDGPN
jgi:hypothetical protein